MLARKKNALATLSIVLLLLSTISAGADDAAVKSEEKPAGTATETTDKPKRELSPALVELRDMVRQTLAAHQKQAPNTQTNSPTEILSYCLAFGCNTQASLNGSNGQRINGITCLCYNYPCAGYEMLGYSQDRIAPRIGYGCQERPGEFLAMLALARVKPDYPIRVAKDTRTVADVIESEKRSCRSGGDMSLKLIGLSYYVDDPEWKDDLGGTWSIERIIREEMAQPVVTAPEGGLNRLLGLSYAVARRERRGEPIDGQYRRAKKYTTDFQEFALQLQNSDGSWGPNFLASRGANTDVAGQLRSTGRVLEWLAVSLPNDKLKDARVMKAVENVASLLSSRRYQWNTPSLPTQEIVSAGHALHGLNVYDQRIFKPADAEEKKPTAEETSPATAAREQKQESSQPR